MNPLVWLLAPLVGFGIALIVVSGGVLSGLGKGVTASSIGVLLKSAGLRVTSIKINEGVLDINISAYPNHFTLSNPLAITAGKKSGDKGVVFYKDPWSNATYLIPAFYEYLRYDGISYARRYAVFPEFLYDDDIPFSIETFIYLKASGFYFHYCFVRSVPSSNFSFKNAVAYSPN